MILRIFSPPLFPFPKWPAEKLIARGGEEEATTLNMLVWQTRLRRVFAPLQEPAPGGNPRPIHFQIFPLCANSLMNENEATRKKNLLLLPPAERAAKERKKKGFKGGTRTFKKTVKSNQI